MKNWHIESHADFESIEFCIKENVKNIYFINFTTVYDRNQITTKNI